MCVERIVLREGSEVGDCDGGGGMRDGHFVFSYTKGRVMKVVQR